ncbi:hypothetical protein BRDID11002_60290 [Bradyrhizobium diazoefficiens]
MARRNRAWRRPAASPTCFLSSAGSFDDEQIALFDEVLERLIGTIELRAIADMGARVALAEISAQLAPIAQAPPLRDPPPRQQ